MKIINLGTLPAATLALSLSLVLSACGGGGDDNSNPGPAQTASITDCFTATTTVSYKMTASGLQPGFIGPNKSIVGPMTFKGEPVTGQTTIYPTTPTETTGTNYWKVTSSGVTFVGASDSNGNISSGGITYPKNMKPGDHVTTPDGTVATLLEFGTISLANRVFNNTCHITVSYSNQKADMWYAPGYGLIKEVDPDGSISQYNGDL